jgi:hypothetical protein
MIPGTLFANQFLPDIRPTGTQRVFGLHGDYQLFISGADVDQNFNSRIFHTLTLEPDARFTSDFRLHARWRPIKNELLSDNEKGTDDFGAKAFKNESIERAFFEGRAGQLDTAGGIVPLEFHNLYMAQDDVVGLLIARNNLASPTISNVRILGFTTAGGVHSKLSGREGKAVTLFGVDAIADTQHHIVEGTLGFLSDANDQKGNEVHAGLSVIRIQPGRSVSLRLLQNNKEDAAGLLVILENSILYPSTRWDRPTLYVNAFIGTHDYQSMAGGSLKNIGFLFDQAAGVPQMDNTGVDRYGFAAGVVLGASRDFSVVPEVAAVIDQSDRNNNDQVGGGVRVQTRLFDTSFLRWDTTFIHQKAKPSAAATTLQAVYKF